MENSADKTVEQASEKTQYSTLKEAYADGWRDRRPSDYGGESLSLKVHDLTRGTSTALTANQWRALGKRLKGGEVPHGSTGIGPVFREDQVEVIPRTGEIDLASESPVLTPGEFGVRVRVEHLTRKGSTGWCALLSEAGGLVDHDFLQADSDDRNRNGRGPQYFRLEAPGVYEASSQSPGSYDRRTYLQVSDNGVVVLLSRADALAILGLTEESIAATVESNRAARLVAREERNVRAAESNLAAGLPALVGSPKQVAWAESIRAAQLAGLDRHLAALPHDFRQEEREGLLKVREAVVKQTDASWWIDGRGRPLGTVADLIAFGVIDADPVVAAAYRAFR